MNPMRWFLPAVGSLVLLSGIPAPAAQVLVDFNASYNNPTPPLPFTDYIDPAAVTAGTGPLSGSLSHYTTTSNATADYGSLLATSNLASTPNDDGASAGAKAGWEDSLTILGAGTGTLKLNFAFSGSLAASDGGDTSISLTSYFVSGTVGSGSISRLGQVHSNFGSLGDPITDFSASGLSFIFGTPFAFNVSLEASTSYGGSIAASSGTGDASNLQLTLTGIEVYDQFNQLVGSPNISSGSGTIYGVPEPSRAMLAAFGIGALAARRRRSR